MDSDYILIAEADWALRVLLADLLTNEGFYPRTASEGNQALNLCERQPPQLLITDLQLPGMGGAELIAELEARKLGTFPVIVFDGRNDLLGHAPVLTADDDPELRQLRRLMKKVRMLLGSRRAAGEGIVSRPLIGRRGRTRALGRPRQLHRPRLLRT